MYALVYYIDPGYFIPEAPIHFLRRAGGFVPAAKLFSPAKMELPSSSSLKVYAVINTATQVVVKAADVLDAK